MGSRSYLCAMLLMCATPCVAELEDFVSLAAEETAAINGE
jgi:hypothetical protein